MSTMSTRKHTLENGFDSPTVKKTVSEPQIVSPNTESAITLNSPEALNLSNSSEVIDHYCN
jgi:hypothetical protein